MFHIKRFSWNMLSVSCYLWIAMPGLWVDQILSLSVDRKMEYGVGNESNDISVGRSFHLFYGKSLHTLSESKKNSGNICADYDKYDNIVRCENDSIFSKSRALLL